MTTERKFISTLIGLTIICIILLVVSMCQGDTLKWNKHSHPDAKYKVHIGRNQRDYSRTVDVGTSTLWKSDLTEPGKYYFAVTAYLTEQQESAYSYEIFWELILEPVKELKMLPEESLQDPSPSE